MSITTDSSTYGMSRQELNAFLAEQADNGFVALGQKERLFALEFIKSGSYVEASEACSIDPRVGRRILRDPLTSFFINHLNQQREHYSLIDAGFIENQYLTLLAKLLGEEDIEYVDQTGFQKTVRRFDGPGAVSALRDLAKLTGHYDESKTVKVQLTAKLTDEQKAILDQALDNEY